MKCNWVKLTPCVYPTYAAWKCYLQNVFKYLGPNKSILLGNISSDQKSFTCPSPMWITKLRISEWSKSGGNTDVQHSPPPECPDRPAASLHTGWWSAWTIQWQHPQKNGLRILKVLASWSRGPACYLALQFTLLLQAKVFRCIRYRGEGLLWVVSVKKHFKRTQCKQTL